MITHTPCTIRDRYALLGNFDVPGVSGKFEVRSNNDRVKRPMLIVVHENWHEAGRRERVAPVFVVQFEADGCKNVIEQQDAAFANKINLADFSRRAVEFFQSNGMELADQCHH